MAEQAGGASSRQIQDYTTQVIYVAVSDLPNVLEFLQGLTR